MIAFRISGSFNTALQGNRNSCSRFLNVYYSRECKMKIINGLRSLKIKSVIIS